MSARRLLGLAVLVSVVSLANAGSATAAPGPPSASCNGGGCGGWFKSAVTVSWSYDPAGVTSTSGCGSVTVGDDTGGADFTCVVYYGSTFYGNSVTVHKDSSPPGVSISPSRGPDANGWYTHPVAFSVEGDDGASGVASCTSGTYSGPDGGEARITGSCTDNAGNTGSRSLAIKYDGTPPTVTATPARPPDANGWYNRPVQVTFNGTDGASGVKECSPAVEYKGPDANPAKLVGQCRDHAGHLSAPVTFELRYDGTKPPRPKVRLRLSGGAVTLAWTAAKDVVLAQVIRAPGLRGRKPAELYRGKLRRFVDAKAKPNLRYWYEVRLFDQAGNRAARAVSRKPLRGVYAPAEGAVVRREPAVAWVGVPRARFYNLQLWAGRRKLLTTWLAKTTFVVPRTWTYQGKRHRLRNGAYTAFVWPAYGTPKNPKYGDLVGRVRFVVKRS